mgnify:CR=1 FL=1
MNADPINPAPPVTTIAPVLVADESVELDIFVTPLIEAVVSEVVPVTFNVPPMYTLPPIPAPPLTVNAPEVVELACVVP